MDTEISKSTSKMCMCFGNHESMLEMYSDTDIVGDLDSESLL